MARDILSEYGPEHNSPQSPRARHGGEMPVRDVHRYSPPQGPTNINSPESPGNHGDNHGNAHCPVAGRGEGGHVGISSERHPKGSQR